MTNGRRSIHARLDGPDAEVLLRQRVHHGSPARGRVSFETRQHRLRRRLEESVGTHVLAPEALADAEQIFLARAHGDEVPWCCDAADGIHARDVGLVRHGIETRHERLCEVATEAMLVEKVRQHLGHHLGKVESEET